MLTLGVFSCVDDSELQHTKDKRYVWSHTFMIVIFSTVVLNIGVLIYLCYFENIRSIEIYIIWIFLLFFNLIDIN